VGVGVGVGLGVALGVAVGVAVGVGVGVGDPPLLTWRSFDTEGTPVPFKMKSM
jgi:hypothetical protein